MKKYNARIYIYHTYMWWLIYHENSQQKQKFNSTKMRGEDEQCMSLQDKKKKGKKYWEKYNARIYIYHACDDIKQKLQRHDSLIEILMGGGDSKDTIPVPKKIPKTAVTCELCGKKFAHYEHLRKHLIICRGDVGGWVSILQAYLPIIYHIPNTLGQMSEDYEM